VALFKRCLNA